MDFQQPNFDKRWLMILIVALSLVLLFSAMSCSPYMRIAKREPRNLADSAALAKRCIQIFPVDTLHITTDSTWHTGWTFDTSLYKLTLDSLLSTNHNTVTQFETIYRDTCTTAKSIYRQGYDIGYKTGMQQGKMIPIRRDTLFITKILTVKDNAMTTKLNGDIAAINKELDKYKWRAKWHGVAMFVELFFLLLLLLMIYRLLVKKTSLI